jgi:hypothetical protein
MQVYRYLPYKTVDCRAIACLGKYQSEALHYPAHAELLQLESAFYLVLLQVNSGLPIFCGVPFHVHRALTDMAFTLGSRISVPDQPLRLFHILHFGFLEHLYSLTITGYRCILKGHATGLVIIQK